MKVKVLKTFKDKHSGKIHKPGDILDISKERFDEIKKVGPLVKELKTPKVVKAEKAAN